ncbi:hypothetical protein PIROE2DRAFT_18577 [Piromyces sp. E2]|nr:hypothetical protein PIROE2DRAFT_18577 [Piromyces sp. E2]|eukprot:OUM56694.1 hypothetical protein PIROE2DRAFT_18577 [Piromyces sp. E2]
MECYYFEYYFDRKFSENNYMDLSKYINKESLKHHDPKILEKCKINKKLYALPYDSDFDNLYFRSNDSNINSIVKNMELLTWDDLLELGNETSSYPLVISLGYSEDMINFFIEYTSNYYNLTKEYDSNFYKVFYNDSSTYLYNSFFDFFNKYTNFTNDYIVNGFPIDGLYEFFMGDSLFFKGKASYSYDFQDIPYISSTLPPKFISVKYNKYLIINNNSNIDKNILVEIATELTSKEMQLYRAKYFGSIPTFDFSNESSNESIIGSYCEIQKEICHQLKQIKSLYTKNIFKSKYSSPYFEVGLNIPLGLYEGLSSGSDYIPNFVFKYTYEMVTTQTVHMVKIIFNLPPYSSLKLKFDFIIDNISIDILYMPILGITYRIFKIYNSNSLTVKYLNDKKLTVENFPLYHFFGVLFVCIMHAICIYILIGSRLLLLMVLHNEINSNKIDPKDFIPISTKQQYKLLMEKIKNLTSTSVFKNYNESKSDSYQVGYSISVFGNSRVSNTVQTPSYKM